ncbi:flagellar basal-body MS-ring/collar protein FliF [Erythrobacter sp.]|jgi:flagellar M-ring protein FliF|uniref:flagellar basal-body MS-ring/collar protein FliF n=1 Tax=Erythrobacter sp. TaxID=1042 RepID=UPI002EBA5CD5|nr:flagellar basal-body MS-ring/collar protein FliF [Erythrobacter sp.]
MSDNEFSSAPAGAVPATSPTLQRAASAPLPGMAGWRARAGEIAAQPAFRRALPALVAVGVVAILALLYLAIAQGPQRMLYSGLSDAERARVVETLDAGGIAYTIDNGTGALSVAEDDVYSARMLVASDAGLAAPQGASEMLDAIPLGSSRTLEGERLRLARERELMLTIREIEGIEAVRVHLATPERSVFVRENAPPSASVMLRLASGRSLAQSQVEAIVNLVAGSVPGMTSDTVRVVDQNGRLLSSAREEQLENLVLQREFEAKLQSQVTNLLLPLLGDGNFSSQVQVELTKAEQTSAREIYDADGVVRSESERSSSRASAMPVGGIPGAASNIPAPDVELVEGAPQEGEAPAGAIPEDREIATQRNYELGREVAVTSSRPGGLVKLSVAVALSEAALQAAAPLTAQQVETLVSAAVGADPSRGDQVEVVISAFGSAEIEPLPFYESAWFAQGLRALTALLAVLLVLLLAVRPLIKRMRAGDKTDAGSAALAALGGPSAREGDEEAQAPAPAVGGAATVALGEDGAFTQKVELARRLASDQPDRAVEALQRMLAIPAPEANTKAAS